MANLLYFINVENEFLHKVNLESLQKETGLSMQGIADLAEVCVQTVYRWAWDKSRQGNRPSYNAVVRLLEKGASTMTLFGVGSSTVPQEPQRIVVTDELVAEMLTRAGLMFKSKNGSK